jgi:hypothetical protein
VLGVLIAYGAWRVMGLNTASLAVAVLTTGYLNNGEMLVARLEDTGIGNRGRTPRQRAGLAAAARPVPGHRRVDRPCR